MIGYIVAWAIMLGGWLLAQSRDAHGLPIRGKVTVGEGLVGLGLVGAVLTLPPALSTGPYVVALCLTLLIGLTLLRGAGRLAMGWTSVAETVTRAAMVGWATPARAAWSVIALAAGVWVTGRLLEDAPGLAGLAGAAAILAPARWHAARGRKIETAQTGVERALAGVLHGGVEHQAAEADQRTAHVQVRFNRDGSPTKASMALPPSWQGKSEETLEEEIARRLVIWGYWLVNIDHGTRRAVAESVEPLPKMLVYDGATATDRGQVTLGTARLSRQAAKATGGRYGATRPFVWDARTSPHGLIVGTTGGGKSSTCRTIITTWCRHPSKRVILLDPKRVEFGLFRGRRGVMTVAETVPEMTAALRQLEALRQDRAALCKRHGATAVWQLPDHLRPDSILAIVDEIMDFLDKAAGKTDDAKLENELRAEALDLINRAVALARVMDIHVIMAGQRLDRKVVDGRVQNNAPLRVLTGVAEAGSTERHMIALSEVEPESATPGRGVARTVGLPECEVQLTYLDEDDLDKFLPLDDTAEREWNALVNGETERPQEGEEPAKVEGDPTPGPVPTPSRDRGAPSPVSEAPPTPTVEGVPPSSSKPPSPSQHAQEDPRGDVPDPPPDPDDGWDPLEFLEPPPERERE